MGRKRNLLFDACSLFQSFAIFRINLEIDQLFQHQRRKRQSIDEPRKLCRAAVVIVVIVIIIITIIVDIDSTAIVIIVTVNIIISAGKCQLERMSSLMLEKTTTNTDKTSLFSWYTAMIVIGLKL